MTVTAPPAVVRILALGDSYTIGEGVRDEERWPTRLAALLRARGLQVAEPIIIAKTGWTTDELARAIDREPRRGGRIEPPFRADLVTLLIGVNNQFRGRSVAEYRNEFRDLVGRAIAFAGGNPSRVIVLSVPDWGVTPFAHGRDRAQIAREIDAFNAANRDESATAGVHYVDITGDTRSAPSAVTSDGLHPSPAMYERWAAVALPVALRALSS